MIFAYVRPEKLGAVILLDVEKVVGAVGRVHRVYMVGFLQPVAAPTNWPHKNRYQTATTTPAVCKQTRVQELSEKAEGNVTRRVERKDNIMSPKGFKIMETTTGDLPEVVLKTTQRKRTKTTGVDASCGRSISNNFRATTKEILQRSL